MLGGIITLTFMALGMTTATFSESTLRQSSEQQLKVISLMLERDLELTDFWGAIASSPVTPPAAPRDGLAILGLSDWNDPDLFEPTTKRPLWNRYVVWHATSGTPGKLVRQVLRPTTPPTSPSVALSLFPTDDLNAILSTGAPKSHLEVLSARDLSDQIETFKVSTLLENGTIKVELKLHHKGLRRAQSMEQAEDFLEGQWTILPRNSWPRI